MSANGFCGRIGAKLSGLAETIAAGAASRMRPSAPSASADAARRAAWFLSSMKSTAPSRPRTSREATTAMAMITGLDTPVVLGWPLFDAPDVPPAFGADEGNMIEADGCGRMAPPEAVYGVYAVVSH